MMKNKGKIRYEIALEIIINCNLNASGTSFMSYKMGELAHYALTGELSKENPTWSPENEDLHEIDYGKPKGIDVIKEKFEIEFEKKYGGHEWE